MNTSQQFKKVISNISETGLILQEILGVITGVKPSLTIGLNEREKKAIIRGFPELAIECKEETAILNQQQIICVLSKEKEIAKKMINAFLIKKDMGESGKLLGYPECCIKKHLYFGKQNMTYQHPKLFYQLYKNSRKHNFLTNNLFNFSTRLEKKEDLQQLCRYYSLNKNFPIPLFYLQFISHIPCSYNCQESIKIGKNIYNLLKKYTPDIEKIITYTLSKPVLFFDNFKWIIFDGYVKENTLFYKKIVPPISLINSSLLNKIKKGNKIFVNNNKIKIFKDSSLIHSYLKKDGTDGFILDFRKE